MSLTTSSAPGQGLAADPVTVGDVVATLEAAYPPGTALDWDAVGLVCGDPQAPVDRVLLAVDPVLSVVDEAVATGAQLLVVHHPLLLRAVHSVAADTPKGRVLHRLMAAGCALYVAHTNADAARDGVNDSLAALLGLSGLRPLEPAPADGTGATGIGRVGTLAEPMTLRGFAELVARRLPATAQGVRVSGDPDAVLRTVALCGGSGDSLFDAVRASGADVYVTADLRHHPASEAREHRGDGRPFLVDVAHWASEWPWLERCAGVITTALGPGVSTHVSTLSTDPWTFLVPEAADRQPPREDPPK